MEWESGKTIETGGNFEYVQPNRDDIRSHYYNVLEHARAAIVNNETAGADS